MATRLTNAELHELAAAVFAAWNAHEVGPVLDLLTEDIVWTEPEGTWHGKGEVSDTIQATFDGFPDASWPMDDVVVMANEEHSMIAVTWRWVGTHTATYNGLPATGRAVDVRGVATARLHGGLISELTFFFDTYAFLEQLGVVPSTEGLGFKVLATAEITWGKAKKALHL
jgi:steroid delta-isomerase-like uncharacterized protein